MNKAWEPITRVQLLTFVSGAAAFFLLLLFSEPGFIFLIDHANLLFHEAGHIFIGFLHAPLDFYGGTLGQLFFPAVLMISFWRKDLPLSFAAALIWFFENWLNIARYMADARAQVLPLVGGGEHDWYTIFSRWNVLAYDTRIALAVKIIGWTGMITACLWILWRAGWYRQDRPRED